MAGLLALGGMVCATTALADGMVVPQVFYPKVEIPNQQALICFSNGVERLVGENWISSWRRRLMVVAAVAGLAVFLLLPKVEVVTQWGGPTDREWDAGL